MSIDGNKKRLANLPTAFLFFVCCLLALHNDTCHCSSHDCYEANDEYQGVYGQADDGEYAEVFQYGLDVGCRLLQSHLRCVAHSVASVLYQVEAFLYWVEVEQCQQHVNNAIQCARHAVVGRDEEQYDSDDEEQCDSDCAKYCHELQPLSRCQQIVLDVFCDS